MGIVQIIWRTHHHEINLGARSFEFLYVAVEAFKLGKKISIGKIAVNNSNRIAFVISGHELVAGFFDGFHVPWGDVAGGADKGKVFFHWLLAGRCWLLAFCFDVGLTDFVATIFNILKTLFSHGR